jgi:hypothetical protein
MTNLSQNKLEKLVNGFKNIWVFLMALVATLFDILVLYTVPATTS